MVETPNEFDFAYTSTRVVYGRGSAGRLGSILDEIGAERVLVVCGSNVSSNRNVIVPVREGLSGKHVDTFDETTPEKRLRTVLDAVDRVREEPVDVVVGVGGGSSLNVARAVCSIAPLDRSREEIIEEAVETGVVPSPDPPTEPLRNVAVPTTMAGADLSAGGSVRIAEEGSSSGTTGSNRRKADITDSRLMATANVYDPDLYATTPTNVLAPSAMNGFDKGIETLYSRERTPIAEAHAVRGLQHLQTGLPNLTDADPGSEAYDHAVLGTVLVQYGRKTNVIHTFGNGVSLRHDVQQGVVHGVMAPHVLRYVFENVHARRYVIADGLGIKTAGRTDDEVADSIVATVTRIRDALDLPTRLRDLDGLRREQFPELAEVILDNYKHRRNPPNLDPTREDIAAVLEAAW